MTRTFILRCGGGGKRVGEFLRYGGNGVQVLCVGDAGGVDDGPHGVREYGDCGRESQAVGHLEDSAPHADPAFDLGIEQEHAEPRVVLEEPEDVASAVVLVQRREENLPE